MTNPNPSGEGRKRMGSGMGVHRRLQICLFKEKMLRPTGQNRGGWQYAPDAKLMRQTFLYSRNISEQLLVEGQPRAGRPVPYSGG